MHAQILLYESKTEGRMGLRKKRYYLPNSEIPKAAIPTAIDLISSGTILQWTQ